jgi:hypothetical protein
MPMILPQLYPISYYLEVQDQDTGYWRVINPIVPIEHKIQRVAERFLWFFTVRYKTVENYHGAIQEARCKMIDRTTGLTSVRIREIRRDQDDVNTFYSSRIVWQEGRWLLDDAGEDTLL